MCNTRIRIISDGCMTIRGSNQSTYSSAEHTYTYASPPVAVSLGNT